MEILSSIQDREPEPVSWKSNIHKYQLIGELIATKRPFIGYARAGSVSPIAYQGRHNSTNKRGYPVSGGILAKLDSWYMLHSCGSPYPVYAGEFAIGQIEFVSRVEVSVTCADH